MAYLDTSVLVAYYCLEPGSAQAQKAISKSGQAVISPLVEVEFYAAVSTKVRRGEKDATEARQVFATFQQHLASGWYGIRPITAAEYSLARDWIGCLTCPLRAPDALHLAAVFTGGLTILTADKDLARFASLFGVRCELIG